MGVKVATLNRDEVAVDVAEGDTVADALSSAGIELGDSDSVSVNGKMVSTDDIVSTEDYIVVSPKIQNG